MLAELFTKSYKQAKEMGWGDPGVVEQVALLHSECSEALESFRDNEPLYWIRDGGKPEGVLAEYADIFIRLGHYLGALGTSVEQFEDIVNKKLQYNLTRGHRHGGKTI